MLDVVRPGVRQLLDAAPFPESDKYELALLHEDSLALLAEMEFDATIRVCQELLKRAPDFMPARNNLAKAWMESGRSDDAIRILQSVIERDPTNHFAWAHLAKCHLLDGRVAEARASAAQLRQIPPQQFDHCIERAEAFS